MAATSKTGRSAPRLPGRVLGIAAAVALVANLVSCSSKEPKPEFLGAKRITVAMHNDLPGISYSLNYDRSGLDFLMFRHLEKELDVAFSAPVDVSSGDRVTQLLEHKADMTIASFSITADRMDLIDFVGPYLKTRQGFLVGPEGAAVEQLEDLSGTRICTWQGTTSQEALDGITKTVEAEPVTLTDASDCIGELLKGRVMAVSTDQAILYGFARHYEKEGLRVVPGATIGAPQYYGIGLSKGHPADCGKLEAWLKEHVGTSTWISDVETSLPALTEENRAWISSHKPSPEEIEARSCRDSISP